MKTFSFMIAFFAGITIFSIFHGERPDTKGMSESQILAVNRESDASLLKNGLFTLASSTIVYFGISGLLIYIKEKK